MQRLRQDKDVCALYSFPHLRDLGGETRVSAGSIKTWEMIDTCYYLAGGLSIITRT